MNKKLSNLFMPLLAVSALAMATPSIASEAIVKKARCVACHTVDAKRVGPAYKDVAPAKLFDKVRAGGSGNWGEVPMMPHGTDKISDDDLKAAVKWILALE